MYRDSRVSAVGLILPDLPVNFPRGEYLAGRDISKLDDLVFSWSQRNRLSISVRVLVLSSSQTAQPAADYHFPPILNRPASYTGAGWGTDPRQQFNRVKGFGDIIVRTM